MSNELKLANAEERAPGLMAWVKADWSGDDIRGFIPTPVFHGWLAGVIRAFHGFGAGKVRRAKKPPDKRHIAYADILFPFEGDKEWFTRYSGQNHCEPGLSSCGLTVRSFWLLIGARHPLLNPPYEDGTVLTYLRAFSAISGAFAGDYQFCLSTARDHGKITEKEEKIARGVTPPLTWDIFEPKVGDTIFLNNVAKNMQHVSTIVEIKKRTTQSLSYLSCDGGQPSVRGDGKCCGIRLTRRTAWKAGSGIKDARGYDVTGWSRIVQLRLPAKFITPFRNRDRLDIPDPPPV